MRCVGPPRLFLLPGCTVATCKSNTTQKHQTVSYICTHNYSRSKTNYLPLFNNIPLLKRFEVYPSSECHSVFLLHQNRSILYKEARNIIEMLEKKSCTKSAEVLRHAVCPSRSLYLADSRIQRGMNIMDLMLFSPLLHMIC